MLARKVFLLVPFFLLTGGMSRQLQARTEMPGATVVVEDTMARVETVPVINDTIEASALLQQRALQEGTPGNGPGGGGSTGLCSDDNNQPVTTQKSYSKKQTTSQFLGTFSSTVNWCVTNNSVTGCDCYPYAAVIACDVTASIVPPAYFGSSASIGASFTCRKTQAGVVLSTVIGYHRWSLNANGSGTCDDSTIQNAQFPK